MGKHYDYERSDWVCDMCDKCTDFCECRKPIAEFEIVDHGIEHERYFQGCGISCTDFADIATGCGDNPAEAVDDALESLAQNEWETEGMESRICSDLRLKQLPRNPAVKASQGECHYYLSIRVK